MYEEDLGVFFRQHGDSDSDSAEDEYVILDQDQTPCSVSENEAGEQGDTARIMKFESPSFQHPINIIEEQAKGIGFQLWPAASFLCQYLDKRSLDILPDHVSNLDCLELGAGVGLVGLFMAALGCKRTWVTDLPEVLPILQRNVEVNPELAPRVTVCPLTWGTNDWEAWQQSSASSSSSSLGRNDNGSMPAARIFSGERREGGAKLVVLLADCVYWPELFGPLLDTLTGLCDSCGATVIMAHTRRWKKDGRFFSLAGKRLAVSKIHEEVSVDAEGARVVMRIFQMSSRTRVVEQLQENQDSTLST
uniref:Calmodulin-lysine N-methyltransferase n=1 Tax=Octactis speculum TaxID=3111310 RepID=A0A7S2GHQ3_9STRA|mmetsp:Transcript_46297/g.62991  ORF Transcript_46297/g.62991 Transcript_46297/m.62991 type:complete len:305 (+) Transcript_46297:51-965(+)|eukprot:CAMPEP_0185775862 /NCGR_PEP_ID=MMETSP1174-20130828/83595_1 /TAXON_ID=35687 /ORGANISM="Dictyocha speculum, Strain CCMP1381" /LENGTH=304 /DNA_ID=CAMNT_0028463585 /DNA_START=27 /DNA_END=941 /DNA_ORIENTATION=-